MPTRIDRKQVEHVAKLARLKLSAPEVETMQAQLDKILDYVAVLDRLDVSKVEPTFHAVPLDAPLRSDDERDSLPRDEALAAAPKSEAGGFAVPKVLEVEG